MKTVRFEQEDPNASASSDPQVALEYPSWSERPSRPRSVLVQKSGHVDDGVQISALDAFYEKDGRTSRYIGEVLDRCRGEDAEDLKRSELDELVESWTCLNAFEGKMWKINLKIPMDEKCRQTWKRNQKNVRDEELVQNGVMDAKNDPKVVMDLFIFKIGGWNILQHSNRKLLEEFINENELWLLIRVPSRDSFLMIQYLERHFVSADPNVKELMPLREGLHEMMQCYRRQHFAASNDLHEHPRRHSSWKESARMKFMNMPSECSKRRSESSKYMWKTKGAFVNSWRIKIALESYFEERAQKTWERNLRKATLLNTWNPMLMATILKVRREQLKEDDQRKTAGEIASSVPETSLELENI